MKQSVTSGFTLIELMITLLIAAIALAVALPQLGSISNQVNFSSIQQNLVSSLILTRSEAVKRGVPTIICASTDDSTCSVTPANWSDGWMIYADQNNSGVYESASDDLIRAQRVDSIANITFGRSNPVTFLGDGTVTSPSTGSFKICDPRGSTVVRGINISLSGRVRSTDSVTCP